MPRGTRPVARNFQRVKIRAIAGFQLNLGQLPAIAGNIPEFLFINLILNNIQILLLYKHYMMLLRNKIKLHQQELNTATHWSQAGTLTTTL